jgi:twitching motility protein PilT
LTFEQIGMPEAIKRLIVRPRGLLLVTGPTGSGKTTSLASMLNFLNENYDRHIITMEDPIEYYHTHKKSTVNQREIGVDVPSFPEAIKRALRMDPDIMLVGEMRDLDTIHAAIEAAETGHVVFGTLHTSGAASTINRIIDVFPKEQQDQIRTQLSTALIGVLSQALLPRKPEGLVAAYEMMVVTPAIQNLIRENKSYRIDSSIQTGRKHGMFLLDESLFRLWKNDICAKEEILLRAQKPSELAAKIAQAEKGILDEEEEFDEDADEDEDDLDDEDDDDRRPRRSPPSTGIKTNRPKGLNYGRPGDDD